MIVIGDIHGCFKTLMALLKQLPDDKIFFVGDLIDKGPRSYEVVKFVIDHPEMQSVRGNHEDFMVDTVGFCSLDNYCLWTHPRNGGQATIDSYKEHFPAMKDRELKDLIPKDHLHFLDCLPEFIIEDNLFISHSAYSGFDLNDQEMIEDMQTWDKLRSLRWYRGTPRRVVKDSKEYFHIFGHTPNPGVIKTDFYANIDTGAVFSGNQDFFDGYGRLTAMQYPSMKIWTQENVD